MIPPKTTGILAAITLSLSAYAFEPSSAREVLQHTLDVVGVARHGDRILHWRDMQGIEQDYQSNPPYVTMLVSRESWLDPASGVVQSDTQRIFLGSGPTKPVTTLLGPRSPGQTRNLEVWAVLADWRDASDVRLLPSAMYQNYSRTVLARTGEYGEERLFIDTKTGFPMKLDREEPHYLWGQVHVEYEYSAWEEHSGVKLPTAAARVVEGFKETTRSVGQFEIIAREKAPELRAPTPPADPTPLFLQPLPPKKVEVSPTTFLSVNTGYTEAIALIGDTVYVFDATQGEKRAKQDLEMIRAAFPGEHKIAVVVTDTAWPHFAGIRFWVAAGATVISHRASKELLTRVIERRWTREPDLLEQRRKSVKFKFVPIEQNHSAEGGKVQIAPIDGIESEGALMAFLPGEGFLWASDYIQNVSQPTLYAREVWLAVQRCGFAPVQVAAEHIPLTHWATIDSLQRGSVKSE